MEIDFISPTEYKFVIEVFYDRNKEFEFQFTNMVDAFKKFESLSDSGDSVECATYTLIEPNFRKTTKTIYKNGRIATN